MSFYLLSEELFSFVEILNNSNVPISLFLYHMIQGYNTNYSLSLIMTLSIINGLQGDMMEVAKGT